MRWVYKRIQTTSFAHGKRRNRNTIARPSSDRHSKAKPPWVTLGWQVMAPAGRPGRGHSRVRIFACPCSACPRRPKRMSRRKVKNHWFVSVAVPRQGHGQQFVRRTETFPTEADAKQFAKEMISEKRRIF